MLKDEGDAVGEQLSGSWAVPHQGTLPGAWPCLGVPAGMANSPPRGLGIVDLDSSSLGA